MSAARNGIPPDVVRKAEMQMKRKAPEDLNGRTRTRRKENDGDDGAVPSSTPSMRFNYALEKQLRESSIAGFAFTCVMHRERSAMKEALTLLRECIDDDAVKISPMKMPCKAFAFLSFIDEEEGEKQVVNNNSSAIPERKTHRDQPLVSYVEPRIRERNIIREIIVAKRDFP